MDQASEQGAGSRMSLISVILVLGFEGLVVEKLRL